MTLIGIINTKTKILFGDRKWIYHENAPKIFKTKTYLLALSGYITNNFIENISNSENIEDLIITEYKDNIFPGASFIYYDLLKEIIFSYILEENDLISFEVKKYLFLGYNASEMNNYFNYENHEFSLMKSLSIMSSKYPEFISCDYDFYIINDKKINYNKLNFQ